MRMQPCVKADYFYAVFLSFLVFIDALCVERSVNVCKLEQSQLKLQ